MSSNKPFSDFDLNPTLLKTIEEIGYEVASPIQELTIAPILEGQDIFAQAETGSGKTAAFSIPILEKIVRENLVERDKKDVLYLVLSPTRELAQQTHSVFSEQGEALGISSVCLIGGESIEKQKQLLNKNPHILVATPGRLCDLIRQKEISVKQCRGVVFDEADRLFDMGFKKDIEAVLRLLPSNRQLIMVSATTNMDVLNTAYKFHSQPLELLINQDDLLVDNIDHKIAMISHKEKMPLLVNLLRDQEDNYAIIFCNTQLQTHHVAVWLTLMDFKAKAISGRLSQNKRTELMTDFRSKKTKILVCTDVAARGLDIDDINLVINYDIPQEAVYYVHRIGRTGRAGKAGEAISFCSHEDCEFLDDIYKLIECKIPKMDLYDDDFAKDLCPRPYIDRKTLKMIPQRPTREPSRKPKTSPKRELQSKMTEAKPPKQDEGRKKTMTTTTERKPQTPRVPSRSQEQDKPIFTVQAATDEAAMEAALVFFKKKSRSFLQLEKSEKGRKKFFLFGQRLTKYTYALKPSYKQVIIPFLIEIIRLARLKLYAKFSLRKNNIEIFFSGQDEKMLTRNSNELLQAFEHLTRRRIYRAIELPREMRISFKCKGSQEQARSLIKMIDRIAQEVIETQEPIRVKPLNASDRKLVHQHIEQNSQLRSESIDGGRLKRIEISPI